MASARAAAFARQSDPDVNRAFRGWNRLPLPNDPAMLEKLADAEMANGRFYAADRLAWLAAGLREAAP